MDRARNVPGYFQTANARLGRSYLGRSVQRGALESAGFYHEGSVNKGFLGLGPKPGQRMLNMPTEISKVWSRRGMKGVAGWAGKRGLAALPLAMTGLMAYQGYQEEGLWGAAKGVAESAAYSAAFHAGAGLVSGAAAMTGGVALGVAAAGFGYYKFGEAAQAATKRRTDLEFGSSSIDFMGNRGAFTARARAMQALNNSHINGRVAIGQEAILTHQTYR